MDYKKQLLEAKKAYRAKDYAKAYRIYNILYDNIPLDNSAKYYYAWTIYHVKIRDYSSREDLLKNADLITHLTRQNNLNHTKLCVYTMAVFKVLKLLYHEKDYDELYSWLGKINPDYLDQIRHTNDGKVYPSNMEQYYIYASVTYFKLGEYEDCINVSRSALSKLNRFTNDSAEFFQWRIAKSYRQLGKYEDSLKFLKILRLDEWYVSHEIAENYYQLNNYGESLKYALKAAIKDGPMDMKYNLYTLLSSLLYDEYPEIAEKHELLCEMIVDENPEREELSGELLGFWKRLDGELDISQN